ncbi:GNAT family N-acetyltransferase [Leptothrix discophora]|uniref:GNAT family N-acetyltransferase n=1 Tax=Leptothrix discophora TaxID=89 RepID=A0ABT9FZY8_LEPDI|nr:GNAT family N-acetyltransferase [Leptothrix discophora]MDP4299612.1 GNAT family N-acetyltransferase [Leptothrix discophora]
MAVLPRHQGRGFGRALMTVLLDLAQDSGYGRLRLHPRAERASMIVLYREQLGMPFGAVFRAITGGEDAGMPMTLKNLLEISLPAVRRD